MRPSSRPPRTASRLSDSLHHQLNMYALAATAAGVGVLVVALPAEAKIVYTKIHHLIGTNDTYNLDLRHDGIYDFEIFNRTHNSTTPFGDYLAAEPLNSGNQIWVRRTSRGFANYAAALPAGFRVRFSKTKLQAGRDLMAFWSFRPSGTASGGPWRNVRDRYLGLKFLIKGKAHYGWARLKVIIESYEGHGVVRATLTGYAYETIANKPIIAGKTKGPDVTTVQSGSLGHLARGSAGLASERTTLSTH